MTDNTVFSLAFSHLKGITTLKGDKSAKKKKIIAKNCGNERFSGFIDYFKNKYTRLPYLNLAPFKMRCDFCS